jgi:hypothetical protein
LWRFASIDQELQGLPVPVLDGSRAAATKTAQMILKYPKVQGYFHKITETWHHIEIN